MDARSFAYVRARAAVRFHGHVQGVFFRANCAERAEELGLDGYVRNMIDGSVEAVFEGERSAIEECIEWNRKSQPHARVTSIDVSWSTPTGEFRGFAVRH